MTASSLCKSLILAGALAWLGTDVSFAQKRLWARRHRYRNQDRPDDSL
jgi:hypothetical protein